ncbi:acetyl-CoA hydrolase/transferase family protein [Tepidibacillus infernus]|uniref:Acetyl-CoA hydrolase n=1 Tax=Tepidibacillus decaturensis TaxID=1413211 RepID=A0A135L2S9_9BACI|nr:acetyl-CoA hydrolase/transferase family protein [Tepidibacillus decaturensis]KXG43209.1 acetyl-CoA hydrolase [Tepidibacillus decaturensis]
MYKERIRYAPYLNRVMDAEKAADFIKDGMIVGASGFTRAGDPKAVTLALAERAKKEKIKIKFWTGASLSDEVDGGLAEAGALSHRLPFQATRSMRDLINKGEILFTDQHLSLTNEWIRNGVMGPIDIALVEAVTITEDGYIIPTTSVGNTPIFVDQAKKVIIEINMAHTPLLEGVHDIYLPEKRPGREPILLKTPMERIGTPYIKVDPEKVVAIVITDQMDVPSNILPADEETKIMANHIIEFLKEEVNQGRIPNSLMPLQSGVGTIANAVLEGLVHSPFEDLIVASEVLQDAVFELFKAGKVKFAAATSVTLSPSWTKELFENFDQYRDKLVFRPQEISNHPELIRRMGLIAINTALEADIYGNVNSTHVAGTHMMNGIGGSGDFARNAGLSIFVTKSIAKDGKISSIVPMVSHVDHTEHDVQILVTEQGLADLRGLAPRERAELIIEKCVHPMYKDKMREYYNEALERGGHTPHVLEKALSWHQKLRETGTML